MQPRTSKASRLSCAIKFLPAKNPGVHLFIADTAQGPALQFADGQTYSTPNDDLRLTRKPHAEIITDRNLYRPGQLVKMKGMMRTSTASGPAIPAATDVHWRVLEAYGDRVAAEGTATLSPYGGWEAEWNIPEKNQTRQLRNPRAGRRRKL